MSQIVTIQTLTMSSREIAELTGKDLSHVNRDIRAMLDALVDDPELDHVREDKDARGYTTAFHLGRELTYTLKAGYSVQLRRKVIARWQELEAAKAMTAQRQDPRAWARRILERVAAGEKVGRYARESAEVAMGLRATVASA